MVYPNWFASYSFGYDLGRAPIISHDKECVQTSQNY